MIKPLNNHCLIEIIDEYAGVIRNNEQENVQKGVLRAFTFEANHLTASTGYRIEDMIDLKSMIGKTVYWQEYADTGNKLRFDDKQYVMVPFYRLIGVEE